MMMAIAWNKLSHSESLHKSGSAYKPPHFLTNRRRVPPKPFSHSLGRKRSVISGYVRPGANIECLRIQGRLILHQTVAPKYPPAVSAST